MKRAISIIITLVLATNIVSVCTFADTSSSGSKKEIKFRDYDWGTSKDEIVENEITSSMKENEDYGFVDDLLIFVDQRIAGYECYIAFQFNDKDELIMGQYVLQEKHSNEQQYYLDFNKLVEKLTSIYGEDTLPNHEVWYDDTYKDNENKKGMAIITGDLQIGYLWKDSNGNSVTCMIQGDNFDCDIFIMYRSKESNDDYTDNVDGL